MQHEQAIARRMLWVTCAAKIRADSSDKSEPVALPVTTPAADLQEEMEEFDVFGHAQESFF